MQYIIMCGGKYVEWQTPRQLVEVKGEPIVARTIRLLKECGVDDIAISSSNPVFEKFGVPVLRHVNYWEVTGIEKANGTWVNGFYKTDYPVCYIFGDVIFSPEAIKTIVNTNTNDIEFFASAPPFGKGYRKEYAEPFAFKVVNLDHFWRSINTLKIYEEKKLFDRHPIAWELWQVIKYTKLNEINYNNFTVINDYTCDIDSVDDVKNIDLRYIT